MNRTIYIIGMALAIMASCQGQSHGHEEAAEEEVHDHGNGDIVFSEKQARLAGLEVETVRPASFRSVVHTGGQIMPAPGDEVTVSATADGIVSIQNGNLTEGSAVGKGQTLVCISSKHLRDGDPIEKAQQSYETARSEWERSKRLVKDRLISVREFEQRKAEYENARISYEALAGKISSEGVKVSVPMGGFVKSLSVKSGDYVSVGTPLATIAQGRRLVLRAEVPQSCYGKLGEIRDANFTTPYDGRVYSLSELDGKLLSFGKSTESGACYLPVTFEFNNRGAVVPGSYVEVYLLGAEENGIVSLPLSALTEEQGLYFVYIKTSAGHYAKREVTLGATDGMRVEIKAGVKSGDCVVVKGACQVMLASRSTVVPEGHHHE